MVIRQTTAIGLDSGWLADKVDLLLSSEIESATIACKRENCLCENILHTMSAFPVLCSDCLANFLA